MPSMITPLAAKEMAEKIKECLSKYYNHVYLTEVPVRQVKAHGFLPDWYESSAYIGRLYVEGTHFAISVCDRTCVVQMCYLLPKVTCYEAAPDAWMRLGLQRSIQCQTVRSSPSAIASYARRALIDPIVAARAHIEFVLERDRKRQEDLSEFLLSVPKDILGLEEPKDGSAKCVLGNIVSTYDEDGLQRFSGTFSGCPAPLLRTIVDSISSYLETYTDGTDGP